LGQRVRIARPPPGKKKWEDKRATVVTLLPVAKHPLEYTIRLDGSHDQHTISADCLEPLVIDEETQDGVFPYLIVNGLMYCNEHRLEVCGACGVDHRMTNYQVEITTTDDFSVTDRLCDDMKRIGAPPREAPSKRSKKRVPLANKALFQPAVNDHLIAIPRDFNPESCDPWYKGIPTEQAALNASGFVAEGNIPESAKLPVRRVRENVVAAAHAWDLWLMKQSSRGDPMMRLLLQDEAQTQVLSLDLVPPIRSLRVGDSTVPVYVVRWAHSLASSMQNALAVMGTMPRNTKMGEIPVQVDEIEIMAAVLKKTGERLDQSFVQSVKKHPHLLSVGVLAPISLENQNAFYQSLGDYCFQCGTSGVDVQKCSICLKASYCSKECQKKNWKFHKKSCAA